MSDILSNSGALKCMLLIAVIGQKLACCFNPELQKISLSMKKRGCKAERLCQTFLPCFLSSLGVRGALGNKSEQQNMVLEWSSAGEERRGKKLTTLIWNLKESATWQSLKSCTCTFIKQALRCASLAPSLSYFLPYFSLFLSLFPFHVLWLGALSFSACFLYTVHSVC